MNKPTPAPSGAADAPRQVGDTVNAPLPPARKGRAKAALIAGACLLGAAGMLTRELPSQVDHQRGAPPPARGSRAATFNASSYNAEARTVDAVFSSGAEVPRYFGSEFLTISEEAIDLNRVAANLCPFLNSHNQWDIGAVLGRVVSARIENDQLVGTLAFADTEAGRAAEGMVSRGELTGISIGYAVRTWTLTESTDDRDTWTATRWELLEVSLVPVPADPNAGVRSAAPHQAPAGAPATNEEDDMNRSLPGGGVAHPNANRGAAPSAADTTVVVEPNGDTRTEPNGAAPANRTAPSIAASRILELCGRSEELGATFASELIRDAEAGTLTEASMQQRIADRLIESRARPSIDARAAQHGTDEDSYRQALADAVTLRATPNDRLDDDPSRPAAQRIAAARDFRGMTMMEMARFHLGRTGTDMRGMGRLQIAGEALGLMRGGALTTSDFANALSFAANRRVRAAFAAAPQTFRQWVGSDTLPDFKPSQIIGLGDAPALLLVPENGEFQRGALADTGLTYRLQTYGRIIPITRQAIVNDDKQLFGRIPTMFGRKAADLESDLVYGTLLSNPTMGDGQPLFSVAAGNLASTGSQITVNSVAAGETAMLQQKNDEGGAMTIRPEFLIVGPLQKVAAQAFLTAVAAAKTSDVNPYPGNLQLVVETRITGYQWFLSASPDAFDTIVLAHLDGQEELFTETRVGFDVDGVEEKARLDVGAAAVDRRGLYRNPGASPY